MQTAAIKEALFMRVIIDRFEGDYAVVELEDRSTANLPRSLVPPGAKEGDVLVIEIDKNATKERRKRIQRLIEELWQE